MAVDFVILGAQKAATSSLQAALRSLPGVYMPEGESVFFEDPEYAERLWEEFPRRELKAEINGIKRPDLLCRADLRGRVIRELPNAKFIAVLRNPIQRAVSAYYHLVRHGHLRPAGLDETLMAGIRSLDRGELNAESTLISYGLYGQALTSWTQALGDGSLMALSQSEVTSRPGGALAKCLEHIGAAGEPGTPIRLPRENRGVYGPVSVRLERWGNSMRTQAIPGTIRRQQTRSRALRLMGTAVVAFSRTASRVATSPPSLRSGTHDALAEIYSEDLGLLRNVVPPGSIDWEGDLR